MVSSCSEHNARLRGVAEQRDKAKVSNNPDKDAVDASNASNGQSPEDQHAKHDVAVAMSAGPSTPSVPASLQSTVVPPSGSSIKGLAQQEAKKPESLYTIFKRRLNGSEALPRDTNGFVSYFSEGRYLRQQGGKKTNVESRLMRIKRVLMDRLSCKTSQREAESSSLPRSSTGSAGTSCQCMWPAVK